MNTNSKIVDNYTFDCKYNCRDFLGFGTEQAGVNSKLMDNQNKSDKQLFS